MQSRSAGGQLDRIVIANPDDFRSAQGALEATIKANIIPNLYNQFGPGMISRKKRPASFLSPTIRASLNEPYEVSHFDPDWFSTTQDVDDLFDCLRNEDDLGAFDVMARVAGRGADFTDVCLGLITDVMVLINSQWETDDMSFVDVTLASNVLKRALREFASRSLPFVLRPNLSKTALVSTLPGEYHNVGAQIIEHILTGSGWTVSAEIPSSSHELSVILRKKWFTLVGLSVTENRLVDQCARVVDDIRANSQNPDVIVMVGGRGVSRDSGAAQSIGADIIAQDAKHALSIVTRIDNALKEIPEVGEVDVRLREQWTNVSQDQKHRNSKSPNRPLRD